MGNLFLTECECYEKGTTNGNLCDQTTGACSCKAGYFGEKCLGKIKVTIIIPLILVVLER